MTNKNKLIISKNIVSLFATLILILIISTCIVCYIIGRNSRVSGSGKIIDTIIIEEPQNTDKLPVYITGKVSYSDGTPYQGTIKLHSKVQETKTNNDGIFFFQNIIYGKHSLSIIDNDENTITQMPIIINQSTTSNKITINKSENGYEINVGINIALIEINLTLDKNNKELSLDENKITVINYKGAITTPKKSSVIKTDIIETNNKNKVMPEGVVVLPNIGSILSNGTFISSTGQIYYSEDETSLPTNIKVANDGVITLPNKTIIKPDGTIIRPKVEETKPVTGDDEEEQDDDPITPEEPDPLTWDAPIVKQGNTNWDQLTTLDLFATNDSEIEGKIYPGVSGKYEFNIENINPYNVLFSIDMKEQEHEAGNINLSYRLKYYDNDLNEYVYVIGNDTTYLKPSQLSTTDKVTLLANSSVTYTLEWTWANENNKAQDLKDGKIGSSNNKVHYIDMTVYIENA